MDVTKDQDPFLRHLYKAIHVAVRLLAVIMVLVIFGGVIDVVLVLYQRLIEPPRFFLTISEAPSLSENHSIVLSRSLQSR